MRRILSFATLFVLVAAAFYFPTTHTQKAQAATFNPNQIISDAFFTDQAAMSVNAIQAFLTNKGSVLATIDPSQLGQDANGRSAAQIIYDAVTINRTDFGHSQGYGSSNPLVMDLNPEVILITLQKEQSLITGSYTSGSSATTNALTTAMGYGCPDSGGCNPAYAGFADQVTYGAAQFMMNFYNATHSTYIPGQTYTFSNTTGAPYNPPATQQVTIANASSSSLYQYTPHVYNGNYNFWYYYNLWFSLTSNGSVAQIVKGSSGNVYYYEPNPPRLLYVPTFNSLVAWNISMPFQVVDDAEIAALPIVGSTCQVCVDDSGNAYLVLNDVKYHISTPSIPASFGLSWNQLTYTPTSELAQIPTGAPMGFMVSPNGVDLYLATNNTKYYFPNANTVFTWGYNFSNIQTVDPTILNALPGGSPVQDFYKVQGGAALYAVSGGQALYIPNPTVAYAWGFDPGNASNVGPEVSGMLTSGPTLTQVAMDSSNGNVYYLSGGQKHYVSSFSKLSSVGQSRQNMISVSPYLLALIPNGSNL